MSVTRRQMMNEIYMELDKTKLGHTEDNFREICDEVVYNWKAAATRELNRGYATGEYRDSIHRETIRATRAEGGNRGGWKSRAVTYDEIAHLLEYGTGKDKKGVGVWFGKDGRWHKTPDTPTPAFGLAAGIEHDFNSTFAKRGKKIRQKSYRAIDRGNRPTNMELYQEWVDENEDLNASREAKRFKKFGWGMGREKS